MRHPTPHVADLTDLSRFMRALQADRQELQAIRAEYDHLGLLGQLLSVGSDVTDISSMRADFNQLADALLDQLAAELHKKAVLGLRSNARVAIDILVRNLFERTADIGFLATDAAIRAHTQGCADGTLRGPALAASRDALRERFAEYVRKYSVYHDIVLLAPDGTILVQLSDERPDRVCRDSLVAESLRTTQPYLETFRATELLPGVAAPLIYSYRVTADDGVTPLGVLCLCFRFEDECARIFQGLLDDDDWTVVTILDTDGRVIASSDPYQFPCGAPLERVGGDACRVVRFAGREYLATTQPTQGYQGYAGPGWVGHALTPLNHAFEMAVAHEMQRVDPALRAGVLQTTTLFSPALRQIPVRAASIQSRLDRAVWNGSAWLSRADAALNTGFAKVLLREIGHTGMRTSEVFSRSTHNLYETVISSVLVDCSLRAALAMDIMDRNLYERANDCRWWALTGAFRDALAGPGPVDSARLSEILRRINGLYTVYSNLLLFDTDGRVLAVSDAAASDLRGRTLGAEWVRRALALPDSQSYCVSAFEPSGLYGDRPTYVYAAAVRDGAGQVCGGVAIVFDAEPQFAAMLHDALPRGADGRPPEGAFAVYAERDGRIIASTDARAPVGTVLDIDATFLHADPGAGETNVVTLHGRYYAVGSRVSSGYREYKSHTDSYRNEVVALVLVPLSAQCADAATPALAPPRRLPAARLPSGETGVEIATFQIGDSWLGLRTDTELEAIDAAQLTALPGMPGWVRGCIMLRDQPVPVIDLGVFLPGAAAPANPRTQTVVVTLPDNGRRIGFEVDALGGIADVAASRIEPLPAVGAIDGALIEALVKPAPDAEDRRILILMSAQSLARQLRAGAPEAPVDDPAAGAGAACAAGRLAVVG